MYFKGPLYHYNEDSAQFCNALLDFWVKILTQKCLPQQTIQLYYDLRSQSDENRRKEQNKTNVYYQENKKRGFLLKKRVQQSTKMKSRQFLLRIQKAEEYHSHIYNNNGKKLPNMEIHSFFKLSGILDLRATN